MEKQVFAVEIEAIKKFEYTKYVVASTAEEAKKIAEKKFHWRDVDTDELLTDEDEFESLKTSILESDEYKNRQSRVDRNQALKQLFECYTHRLGCFEQADNKNYKTLLKPDGTVLTFDEFSEIREQ
jgi:hypothetical protein